MIVVLRLSEHDAERLLLLVKQQKDQAEPVWKDYWQRLAERVHEKIGRSYEQHRRSV